MNLFSIRLACLALILSLGLAHLTGALSLTHAQSADDPILNSNGTSAWGWEWTCPGGGGGSGKTVIAWNGKTPEGQPVDKPISGNYNPKRADGSIGDTYFNFGTWEFDSLDQDQNRVYNLKWSSSTDHLTLSGDVMTLEGPSGGCHVVGKRRSLD